MNPLTVTVAYIRGAKQFKQKDYGLRNKATFKDDSSVEKEIEVNILDAQHLEVTELNENHNHPKEQDELSLSRKRKRHYEERNDEATLSSLTSQRTWNCEEKSEVATTLLGIVNTKNYSFENICRTCYCEGVGLQSLFGEDTIRIVDMLTEITDLKIMEGDPFPQNICSLCLEKLKDAYNFIKQCHYSRIKFEKYLNNSIDHSSASNVDSSSQNDVIINDTEIKQEFILHEDSGSEWNDETKNENSEAENEEKPKNKIHKPTLHECPICSKKIQDLKKHMRSHTNEKPYKCDLCGMEFSSRFNCLRHIQIHLNDRPHVCEICNRAFTTRYNLTIHMKTHSTETPFKCEICEKSFKHLSKLKFHTTETHQDSKQCSEILASIDTQRNFLCDLCGKIFLKKHVLENHKRAHTGEKPFSCSVCGKTFSTSPLLCSHRQTHNEEKPYKCTYCDKHFLRKKSCKIHELIHTGVKPLHCDLCGKYFRQSAHLKRHKRIHTGEKPYACTICDKHFIDSDRLNAHIRVQHTAETFACSICNKKFKDLLIMRRHEKKVHATGK